MLKEIAMAFAEALYERLAHDNLWYEHNPNRSAFVKRTWPTLLPAVRTHLAQLLGMNTISEEEKVRVHDAIVKDHSLRLGRHRARVLH